jgi:hypothetical protein
MILGPPLDLPLGPVPNPRLAWEAMRTVLLFLLTTAAALAQLQPNQPAAPASPTTTVPTTRPATTRPSSLADAHRIVFLVDTRLPTQTLPWLRDELRLAIEHLRDDQLFTIIILRPQNQVPRMLSSTPIRASASAKGQAIDFLRAVESQSSTNPVPGIRKAVELQPDLLIYIPDQTTPQTDAVRQAFRLFRGRLNIVLFGGQAFSPVEFLRTLALEHGGVAMDMKGSVLAPPKPKVEAVQKPESRPSVFEK